uniref:Testis expressed 12 n=1 Tax=Apteryx owenii TaxID=8824 RepID=A0A8B9NY33_APTOW
TMTSNTQKSDENRSKRKKEMESEASENPQLSSLEKTDLSFSEGSQSLYKPEPLEKVLNVVRKLMALVLILTSDFFQLSDRAAMDASYVQELDGILKEAKTIENHLKQKRESLKQRFTVIANTLQS